MVIEHLPDYEEKAQIFKKLMQLRGAPREDLDQRYLTFESILKRLNALEEAGKLDGKRVLAFGDADLSALAIAIFGNPVEVVVADIDERLSEIYFDAHIDYDLPVRYLYHDLRIKIIEILLDQYSLILVEPSWTRPSIKVSLSRAVQCIMPGEEDSVFISLPPNGDLRDYANKCMEAMGITVIKNYGQINEYENGDPSSDFLQVKVDKTCTPLVTSHWIGPYFEQEVKKNVSEYECKCGKSYSIGPGQEITEINSLQEKGCHSCGYSGVFSYKSIIPLK